MLLLLRILTLKDMIKCAKHSNKTERKVILHTPYILKLNHLLLIISKKQKEKIKVDNKNPR